MPRIRTIKPEFCVSEQIGECSTSARLLFVTSWMFFDDGGNHPFSVMQLKAECFPYDTFTREDMLALVRELVEVGLYRMYEADGKLWLNVSGWHHQKIDRPSIKYPEPEEFLECDEIQRAFDDYSTSTRRVFVEDSSRATPRSLPESTVPESTVPSLSQTDVRDEASTKKRETYSKRFEERWFAYPARDGKRVGKRQASKQFSKQRLDRDDQLLADFDVALDNYARFCESTKRIPRDMERFLRDGDWKEWIDPPESVSARASPGRPSIEELVSQIQEDGG